MHGLQCETTLSNPREEYCCLPDNQNLQAGVEGDLALLIKKTGSSSNNRNFR